MYGTRQVFHAQKTGSCALGLQGWSSTLQGSLTLIMIPIEGAMPQSAKEEEF